jgi:hypothetical protein
MAAPYTRNGSRQNAVVVVRRIVLRSPCAANPVSLSVTPNEKGGRSLCRPFAVSKE